MSPKLFNVAISLAYLFCIVIPVMIGVFEYYRGNNSKIARLNVRIAASAFVLQLVYVGFSLVKLF